MKLLPSLLRFAVCNVRDYHCRMVDVADPGDPQISCMIRSGKISKNSNQYLKTSNGSQPGV